MQPDMMTSTQGQNALFTGGPSRGNSGGPSHAGGDTLVFSLRGPTEVILAQMKMNAAHSGSIDSLTGAAWRSPSSTSSPHRHTQSGSPKAGAVKRITFCILPHFVQRNKDS